jgi:hypothetical protein
MHRIIYCDHLEFVPINLIDFSVCAPIINQLLGSPLRQAGAFQ